MRLHVFIFAMTAIVLAWVLSPAAYGQGLTSLNGLVADKTGAVIPDAEITLQNVDTGFQRIVRSQADGSYAFPQIQPGSYKVVARTAGFNPVTIDDLRLLVNTPATINIRFEQVGTLAESVTVQAEAQQINLTDASLGNSFGTLAVVQLPFESRNVVGLLRLQPGVTDEGAVNGGKTDQGNVTLDGVDVNDQQDRWAFTSVLRTTLDSVQEFRVTTLNPGAELGRTSGAQVALVTKSGTNELHGSLYEYHRNTATTANSFANNRSGTPRPKLIRNIFGGSLGGPFIKNKLFYFFNFEGTIDAYEASVYQSVPMQHMRDGFLRYRRADGSIAELDQAQVKSIVDPAGIGVNPVMLDYMSKYPQPNDAFGGDGVNTLGFRFNTPLRNKERTYITRLDYNADNAGKHVFFFRGNLQNDRYPGAPQFPGQDGASTSLNNSKGFAAGYNTILRPNLIGTLRYGLTRQGLGWTGIQTSGQYIDLVNAFSDLYPNTYGGSRIVPAQTISEDMNWIKGSHTIQFGGVARIIRNRSIDYGASAKWGSVLIAFIPGAGFDLYQNLPDIEEGYAGQFANMAAHSLGIVPVGGATYLYDKDGNLLPPGDPKRRNFAANEYEFYLQDTWRATRGLTVTAGLRWNLFPPLYEKEGFQSSLVPNAMEWLDQRRVLAANGRPQSEADQLKFVLTDSPEGGPLYPYHKKNFSPRVSLAYSPQSDSGWKKWLFGGPGKTSIRAGFGLLYDLLGQNLIYQADILNLGFQTSLRSSGSYSTATAPRLTSMNIVPEELIPAAPAGGFPRIPPSTPGVYQSGGSIDSRLKPPYNINLNVSIGRQFGRGLFVQGSYVGRLSHRSLAMVDPSEPLNLIDKKSGMGYFEAANLLVDHLEKGTPVEEVPPIPFWENLWPAAAGEGLTATQQIYQVYGWTAPDWGASSLYSVDTRCWPACSIFGPGALVNTVYNAFPNWTSAGWGSYHGMQWTVRKQFSNGLSFDVNYTFSKSLDLLSGEERSWGLYETADVINTSDYASQYGPSSYDYRHQINSNWVWQLPFGKGQKVLPSAGGILDALVGGWQLSGVFTARSGRPVDVRYGWSWPTSMWVASYTTRTDPNRPKSNPTSDVVAGDGRPYPNLFSNPQDIVKLYRPAHPGETGNNRAEFRGPRFTNIDLGLAKRFKMPYGESHSIQFRAEAFNALNHTNWDVGRIDLVWPEWFGVMDWQHPNRVMQFALRYEW